MKPVAVNIHSDRREIFSGSDQALSRDFVIWWFKANENGKDGCMQLA
ncbi:hypothetical protein [Shewanella sp. cp20]|nr:hypothetical protein [Shewanella sp. cp20]